MGEIGEVLPTLEPEIGLVRMMIYNKRLVCTIFSFLGKEVRQQTCFFLFFHFALKEPQNFKGQVQLYIPVHLQLKVSVTLNENLCPRAHHTWFEP